MLFRRLQQAVAAVHQRDRDAAIGDQRRRWKDFGLTESDLLASFEAVKPFNTSDALRAFYTLYADKHGKPRWGDKTPDYIRKMKKIQNTSPIPMALSPCGGFQPRSIAT